MIIPDRLLNLDRKYCWSIGSGNMGMECRIWARGKWRDLESPKIILEIAETLDLAIERAISRLAP